MTEQTHTRAMPSDLAGVLSPIDETTFRVQYLGRRFCLVEGPAEKFAGLLTWDMLNDVLTEHRLDYPRLRIVKNGEVLPPREYLEYAFDRRGAKYARVRPRELLSHVRSGALLHLASIDEAISPLAELRSKLEVSLGGKVFVNAMLGTNHSKGFDLHWDSHDVLVVQVAGQKEWKVFGSTDPYPIRNVMDTVRRPDVAIWEGILSAGDVLYLPRGCWHSAQAMDVASLHLTIGVVRQTGLDILDSLRHRLANEAVFRQDLPQHGSIESQRAHFEELRELLLSLWTREMMVQSMADFAHDLGAMDRVDLP